MMGSRALEYFQSVKIRGYAISAGEERGGGLHHAETRKRKLFRSRLYAKTRDHRRCRMGNQWDTSRMGSSPNSRQLRPGAATNTNTDRRHAETDRWEIERRHTCPGNRRDAILELLSETRYGRLLITTEMYPCVKRACLSLEATNLIRIGKMEITGREQKSR